MAKSSKDWCPKCHQKLHKEVDDNNEPRLVCRNRSCKSVWKKRTLKPPEVHHDPVAEFVNVTSTPVTQNDWKDSAERGRALLHVFGL